MKTSARLAALLLALASLQTLADADGPWPVNLAVGASFEICSNGSILCPANQPICDDPTVALFRDGKNGLEILAVGPGTTMCSAAAANRQRRVYRVTVKAASSPDDGPR